MRYKSCASACRYAGNPLLFILLLNPVLTLRGSQALAVPLPSRDENIGPVSLLAAVEPKTLVVVRGAALSGKVSERIRTRFVVEDGRIVVHLDQKDRAHRINKDTVYG
jgi:hypothetical protein